jgi:hypothetical protein
MFSSVAAPRFVASLRFVFPVATLGWLVTSGMAATSPKSVSFEQPISSHAWTLKELDPELPTDWTGYDFLVLEFRATSSQRFELGLKTATDLISKRIHPYPNVWVRASIPLRFYRQGLGNAGDLAATVNQPRNSYWINIEGGSNGPTTNVQGIDVTMRYPVGAPKLEIRSVTLAKTDPGDAVLDGNPIIDEFGQTVHVDWPGKAHSEDDLKKAWAAEAAALTGGTFSNRDAYGGFAGTKAKATGFFRVEQIEGRWWFVTPDGHLFYSAGVNGIGPGIGTRVSGREEMFAALPPPPPVPAGVTPPRQAGTQASFYTANLQRRYGSDWRPAWAQLTAQRLEAWGLNTSYGTALSDVLNQTPHNKPYVITLPFRMIQVGPSIMGMPDVYADSFAAQADTVAANQLGPRKDDPYLLGYFIGNEPPWPGRESQFVDLVLEGAASAMQQHFKAELAKGDTLERRRDLVLGAFEHYLAIVNRAVKKADPNHLNLGIRFGGTPPDYVVALAKDFDVYSLNKYRWEPPPELLKKVYALVGKPLLLGEFHIGVPGRGLAPGLVMAMNQEERGAAYRYYVEHAAANPNVIGTHWFQWIDQPATGRTDGENYNIGWVDVTDRPYTELVEAAKLTHARLMEIHLGKTAPTERRAIASEVGTPAEANAFGRPAIQ